MGLLLQWLAVLGIGAILGGIITHILTTLTREAEREFDRVHAGYVKLLETIRNILETDVPRTNGAGLENLFKGIDSAWLYASDEVIRILNEVTDRARGVGIPEDDKKLIGRLIVAMRKDLWKKGSLLHKFRPWKRTSLKSDEYRLIGPGSGVKR